MSDLGKGDVVEALYDMPIPRCWGTPVAKGQRGVVVGVRDIPDPGDDGCKCGCSGGIDIAEFPLLHGAAWCVCGWRRIGPGREELTRRFAEDLNVGPGLPTTIPETVTA